MRWVGLALVIVIVAAGGGCLALPRVETLTSQPHLALAANETWNVSEPTRGNGTLRLRIVPTAGEIEGCIVEDSRRIDPSFDADFRGYQCRHGSPLTPFSVSLNVRYGVVSIPTDQRPLQAEPGTDSTTFYLYVHCRSATPCQANATVQWVTAVAPSPVEQVFLSLFTLFVLVVMPLAAVIGGVRLTRRWRDRRRVRRFVRRQGVEPTQVERLEDAPDGRRYRVAYTDGEGFARSRVVRTTAMGGVWISLQDRAEPAREGVEW